MCIEESKEDKTEEHCCESTDNVEGCKGEECCCARRTIIHRNVVDSATSHRGANNGRSTTKVDGNGAA
jgi:hypothetical protein